MTMWTGIVLIVFLSLLFGYLSFCQRLVTVILDDADRQI